MIHESSNTTQEQSTKISNGKAQSHKGVPPHPRENVKFEGKTNDDLIFFISMKFSFGIFMAECLLKVMMSLAKQIDFESILADPIFGISMVLDCFGRIAMFLISE